MPLTDSAIRAAQPREKPYKLFDGRGLFLHISPAGAKTWRLKYRFAGREKLLTIGPYPEITLKRARIRAHDARVQLTEGIDPSAAKRAEKRAADTFELVALEWHAKQARNWTDQNAAAIRSRLQRWVFPWLGARPVVAITAPEILEVLRRVERSGALETAHRIRGYVGQVMRYAVVTGRAERDVAADLRGALPAHRKQHHAAVTDPKALGALLRAVYSFQGTFPVACALKLTPMLFARPGELRRMEWAEVDLEAASWMIPAGKMKSSRDHIVPLPAQAIEVLEDLQPLTGRDRYVFPSERGRGRPMSENTVNAALRRLGYSRQEVTAHGFRATARTLLDEVLQFRPDIIEHQLAHAVRDPNGRAYNRTKFIEQRRTMMQTWADYLDTLREGTAKVIPIGASA